MRSEAKPEDFLCIPDFEVQCPRILFPRYIELCTPRSHQDLGLYGGQWVFTGGLWEAAMGVRGYTRAYSGRSENPGVGDAHESWPQDS